MDSINLKNHNFSQECEFLFDSKIENKLINIPKEKGVYALVCSVKFGRLNGESDILYIGSASGIKKGLHARIWQYIRPRKLKTAQRISTNIKCWKLDAKIHLWLYLTPSAKELEHDLLTQHEVDHWELPPWNRILS